MKKYSGFLTVAILLALAMLNACDDDQQSPRKNGLHANAGSDQTIRLNQVATLDGSASHDETNGQFTFLWTVKTKPLNTMVTLATPTLAKTAFSVSAPGIYVLELTIRQAEFTSTDQVTVNVLKLDEEPNTPRAVILNENINADRNLINIFDDATKPDYIVTTDLLVRGNLTISPGVVIAFEQNTSLQMVAGFISAKGTNDKRIVFRGMVEQSSFWKGLVIHSNSEANEFDYVTVAHGGSNIIYETGVRANVTVMGTEVTAGALSIRHTTLSQSGGYGLYVKGLAYLNAFEANIFEGNQANPSLYIPAQILHTVDPAGTLGVQSIETGGTMFDDQPVTWKPIADGYVVTSPLFVRSQLTLQPGTTLRMKTGITIDVNLTGALHAVGTEQMPIRLTSTGAGVRWNGLFFNSSSSLNELRHVEVSGAGLNRIADAAKHANIVIGRFGKANISKTTIRDGLGYGVVAHDIDNVNPDVVQVNTFSNLSGGLVYPDALNYPDRPALTGEWVDGWSLNKGYTTITDVFYNKESGVWFNGAATPWTMPAGNGMGIRFAADGTFTWVVAEAGPMTGCASFNAEYMTGTYQNTSDMVYVNQDYWRSKFVNPCDASQNVDTEVTPQQIQLPYTITKVYNAITGEVAWELKFVNADGSTFSFYRK